MGEEEDRLGDFLSGSPPKVIAMRELAYLLGNRMVVVGKAARQGFVRA
jgi:hypothetical protein